MPTAFRSAESGYTLIEVLIALAIFSLGFMAMGALQSSSLMQTGEATRNTEAWTVLEDQSELLKALPFYANDNGADDDGDGVTDETDEELPVLAAGPHNAARADGRYTVHWQVVDDDPVAQQANIWTSAPANITVSKTITVAVTRPGENWQTDALAFAQFVKTWASDGMQ
jgi:prepilin-type N-terminal cleavage/methylation domain-containing protein